MMLASLCLSLAALQQPGSDPSDPTVDATLIIFNDEVLTASELSVYMERLEIARPDLEPQQIFTGAVVNAMRDLIAAEGFRRMGLDQGLLEPEIENRINGLVNESGSRDSFMRSLEKDGYRSIEAFREDLRTNLISNTFRSVATGISPMPKGGRRVDTTPRPEEVRAAYDQEERYRKQPETLEWAILQFLPRTGMAPPHERAEALRQALEAGELSVEEAMRQADKARPRQGLTEGMRADWADFLDFAVEGQAGELSETAQGVVQFPLMLRRVAARDIPFPEAQVTIIADLQAQKADEALREAEGEVWATSYVWLAPNLAELKTMLDEHYEVNLAGTDAAAEL